MEVLVRCRVCRESLTWIGWRYWHVAGWPATGGHEGVPGA